MTAEKSNSIDSKTKASTEVTSRFLRARKWLRKRHSYVVIGVLVVGYFIQSEMLESLCRTAPCSIFTLYTGKILLTMALGYLLLLGPWHVIMAALKFVAIITFIPIRIIARLSMNNWEALLISLGEFALSLSQKRTSAIIMFSAVCSTVITTQHSSAVAGYVSIFLSITLVLHRFFEQFTLQHWRFSQLNEVASKLPGALLTTKSKPRLKVISLDNSPNKKAALWEAAKRLAGLKIIDRVLKKAGDHTLRYTFYAASLWSLAWSILLIFIACLFSMLAYQAILANSTPAGQIDYHLSSMVTFAWRSLIFADFDGLPMVPIEFSTISGLTQMLVVLQLAFFFHIITKIHGEGTRRLTEVVESELGGFRKRKVDEMRVIFHLSPQDLESAIRNEELPARLIEFIENGKLFDAAVLALQEFGGKDKKIKSLPTTTSKDLEPVRETQMTENLTDARNGSGEDNGR